MKFNLPQSAQSRRVFLQNGSLILAAAATSGAVKPEAASAVRVGLITDLHYADKPSAGSRHYRETLRKLEEAGQQFERDQPAFLVELGDFIDAADSVQTELSYLKTIDRPFSAICQQRHYVLGNHCVDTLKKEEFLGEVGQSASYYAFQQGGFRFLILDSCFRSDGQPYGRRNFQWTDPNIPAAELEWLKSELQSSDQQVVVFAHQRLDVSNSHGVKNNVAVRQILEDSGKVLAVFQGHSHQNDVRVINGIPYCTLVAMVEGSGVEQNGYSLLDIQSDGSIHVTGFRKQKSHDWQR